MDPTLHRPWTRRRFVKAVAALGGGAAAARLLEPRPARAADPVTPIRYTPFAVELPIPEELRPTAPFASDYPVRPEWTRDGLRHYLVRQREATAELIPGVQTPIWGYEGRFPGPTIRARIGQCVLVRFENRLAVETSIHHHGGHNPSDSDGNPWDVIEPGHARDYCYPMVLPGGDPGEAPSTTWYHDHALDLTGPHVYAGLAGMFLVTDDVEDRLVEDGVLPGGAYDVPLLLQDRVLNRDGTLHYDPFAHDGFLGDLMLVNGKVQPRLRVERRKYRFRILNGANARFYELGLTWGRFQQVGADSWLLPSAIPRSRILLSGAERADVIVDFRDAPDEVFLFDGLLQDSGRGPDGKTDDLRRNGRLPLLRFEVHGPNVRNDAPGPTATTVLRPDTRIDPAELRVTRTFSFGRRNGGWVVNDEPYDPERIDARPRLGTAERWRIVNGSGGWWHPIHVHLEGHHVERFNGRTPPAWLRGKKDTTLLGPNDEAVITMRFRTFPGPFVLHCHNVEHEDYRMMANMEVVP
jgi:FtsP/CotA-like multicopper oxidase with cupredoxin domain